MKKIYLIIAMIFVALCLFSCDTENAGTSSSSISSPLQPTQKGSVDSFFFDSVEEAAQIIGDEKAFWEFTSPKDEEAEKVYAYMRENFLRDGFLYKPVYEYAVTGDRPWGRYVIKPTYMNSCTGVNDSVNYGEENYYITVNTVEPVEGDYKTLCEYYALRYTDFDKNTLVASTRKAETEWKQIYIRGPEIITEPIRTTSIAATYYLDDTHYVQVSLTHPKATEEMLLDFIDQLTFEKVMLPERNPADPAE